MKAPEQQLNGPFSEIVTPNGVYKAKQNSDVLEGNMDDRLFKCSRVKTNGNYTSW